MLDNRDMVSADLIGTDIDVATDAIFVHPPVEITELERETIENDEDYKKHMVRIDDLVPTQQTVNMRRVKDAIDSKGAVRVWDDSGTLKLVDGHHRTALRKLTGSATVPAFVCKRTITAAASPAPASAPAPKPAPPRNHGKPVMFSQKTEETIEGIALAHNAKSPVDSRVTVDQLRAVYRRAAQAFSTDVHQGALLNDRALARVNAFVRLMKSGQPANAGYVFDNDLLPATHRLGTAAPLTASALVEQELTVSLLREDEYDSPETALLAMAELSGAGYEIVPALRAAWLRGVRDKESPFRRASLLASALYDGRDADLLPTRDEEGLN